MEKYEAELFKKAMSDVTCGCAMGFKMEDVGRIGRLDNICVFYFFTFEEPKRVAWFRPRRPVKADINWERVPVSKLGGGLDVIFKRGLGLMAKFGVRESIFIQKMDAKSALR